MAWSEHVVVRDGVRLACRDRGGPGQPIVLQHGLAGHVGEWDALARRLSPRYRVVAVDERDAHTRTCPDTAIRPAG